MSIEITQTGGGRTINLLGDTPRAAKFLTRRALKDIAGRIEGEAKAQAPMRDTGALKEHPVDIFESREGRPGEFLNFGESIETRAIPFGSGAATVRGEGGRFVRATPFTQAGIAGTTFEEIDITVARIPRHAIWVHQGTGIYGPRRHPIVPRRPGGFLRFHIDGRLFIRRSVKGQVPQPFLTEAYVIINNSYVPLRVEQLRLEIDAIT